MKVCINCNKEITIKNKVHVSPFCFFGFYECSCGMVGQLPLISKNISEEKRLIIISSCCDYSFADTIEHFEIGDSVELNNKEYIIKDFYKSNHAKNFEIDWLRLQRTVNGIVFYIDANPSEVRLIARSV